MKAVLTRASLTDEVCDKEDGEEDVRIRVDSVANNSYILFFTIHLCMYAHTHSQTTYTQ